MNLEILLSSRRKIYSMHSVDVLHQSSEIEFTDTNLSEGLLNGVPFHIEVLNSGTRLLTVRYKNRSYPVIAEHFDAEERTITIRLRGKKITIPVKDTYDLLLDKLGISDLNKKKTAELKSPMPGLVIRLAVNEGDLVKKGDNLVILEAMKMENVLKSPADGLVKSIHCQIGQAVEKNQVLLKFD